MKINLDLQPGKKGNWEVKKFIVSDHSAKMSALRAAINGRPERAVDAGEYWMLTENGYVYMSNTPAEVRDHYGFIRAAKGSVLIAGLGLGMVIKALLDKPEVTRIVVVELSQDVIDLVGPAYTKDSRVEIICEDIFKFKTSEHFDYAWFDIWPDICADNYPEMKKLHRKFSCNVTVKDSWCRDRCKKLYEYDKKYY